MIRERENKDPHLFERAIGSSRVLTAPACTRKVGKRTGEKPVLRHHDVPGPGVPTHTGDHTLDAVLVLRVDYILSSFPFSHNLAASENEDNTHKAHREGLETPLVVRGLYSKVSTEEMARKVL